MSNIAVVASGGGKGAIIRKALDFLKKVRRRGGRAHAPTHGNLPARPPRPMTMGSHQSPEFNRAQFETHGQHGISGVYDPASGTFHARVSGGPNALVDRFGGHATINAEEFGGSRNTVGFVAVRQGDGIGMRWNSASVNMQNFGDRAAPMQHRGPIMDEIRRATGLEVIG